jgi:hypothetical protein
MLKLLASDGCVLKNVEGSHRQFVHPVKPGRSPWLVAQRHDPKRDRGIDLRQAGLKRNTAKDETQKEEG